MFARQYLLFTKLFRALYLPDGARLCALNPLNVIGSQESVHEFAFLFSTFLSEGLDGNLEVKM